MAVHGDHSHLRWILSRQDAGNIAVGLKRQIKLTCLVTLDVVAHDTDLRVLFARNRILIGIEAWIVGIFVTSRSQSLKQLHRVLFHLTLVKTHPHHLLGVSSKDQS